MTLPIMVVLNLVIVVVLGAIARFTRRNA